MMGKTARRFAVCGLMAIGLTLSSIGTARPADLTTVRITVGQHGAWDTTMAFTTGVNQGFFEKEGIKLDLFYTRGGAETLQPVAMGNADFGWANGTFGVLGAYAKGARVKIVSAEFTGVDMFWYVKADSPYKTFSDLAGKKVGYTRAGSSSHLVLLRMEELKGVDVDAVPAGGFPDQYTAVMTGQITAGLTVPPSHVQDVRDGKIRIVARGSDFPSFDGVTFRVNIGNSDFLQKNPSAARAFFRAYQKALEYNYDHMEEVLPEFAKMNKVSLEVARDSLKFYPPKSVALSPVDGMDFQVQKAVEFGFLKKPLTKEQLGELVDLSYLPK